MCNFSCRSDVLRFATGDCFLIVIWEKDIDTFVVGKALLGQLPFDLNFTFILKHKSSNGTLTGLCHPKVKTELGKLAFSCFLPHKWNKVQHFRKIYQLYFGRVIKSVIERYGSVGVILFWLKLKYCCHVCLIAVIYIYIFYWKRALLEKRHAQLVNPVEIHTIIIDKYVSIILNVCRICTIYRYTRHHYITY